MASIFDGLLHSVSSFTPTDKATSAYSQGPPFGQFLDPQKPNSPDDQTKDKLQQKQYGSGGGSIISDIGNIFKHLGGGPDGGSSSSPSFQDNPQLDQSLIWSQILSQVPSSPSGGKQSKA